MAVIAASQIEKCKGERKRGGFLSSRETAITVPPPLHHSLIIALTHPLARSGERPVEGERERERERPGKNIHFCRVIPISDDGRCIFSEKEEKGEKEEEEDAWNSVFLFRSCPPLLFTVMKEKGEREGYSSIAPAVHNGDSRLKHIN